MRTLLLAVFAGFLVLCARPAPARADLASTVYGDVRDVVEELIQSEVAVSVVATIRTRSPALAFYFDETLERLESPYWGSLPRVFREDLTEAVGDLVYFHLTSERTVGDVQESAERFFQCVARPDDTGDDCQRLRGAVLTAHRSLLDAECIRAVPPAARRVACDLGLATRAALAGRGAARRHVMDAVADTVLAEVDGPLNAPLREILLAWLDHPDQLPTDLIERLSVADLMDKLGDTALDKLCGEAQSLRDYVTRPDSVIGWACFAVSAKQLPELLEVNVIVTSPGVRDGEALTTVRGSVAFWTIDRVLDQIADGEFGDKALYTQFAQAAFDDHCRNTRSGGRAFVSGTPVWPCSDPVLKAGTTIHIDWLGVDALDATVDDKGRLKSAMPKELARWMKRWQRISDDLERLRSLLPPGLRPLLFVPDTGSETSKAALRATVRMARLAQRIRDRWYLWSKNADDLKDLDVGELLKLAREAAYVARDSAADVGDELGDAAGAAGRDLGDWFRLIMKADHRTLAIELLRAGLVLGREKVERPHERFFISLAAYVLDAATGDAQEMTRSAFRAAAKDLLLRADRRGVPRADDRLRGRWLPRLAMRYSVNEANAVTPTGSNRRTVVAADWPTAMVAFSDYAGLEVSLLDPAAPLAELGLRPTGSYSDEKWIALDAVRPRVGLWAAVPQLTRRLAISAGGGARLIGLDVESTADEPLRARYVRRVSLTLDLGLELVF